MAKKKKKFSEIKDALLLNTSYIKNADVKKEPSIQNENLIGIDKHLLSKLKILANYYQKDVELIINEAIAHFLRLKKMDIDEALKNMVVGDDEDN